jgi:hypothetical protein
MEYPEDRIDRLLQISVDLHNRLAEIRSLRQAVCAAEATQRGRLAIEIRTLRIGRTVRLREAQRYSVASSGEGMPRLRMSSLASSKSRPSD